MSAAPLLEVDALSVCFRRRELSRGCVETVALSRLSLGVGAGELVAVVGSSGAGKSVLAHAVLGLLPRNAVVTGCIEYRGAPLSERKLGELRGREIALLPQSVSFLDPLMSAHEATVRAARRAGLGRGAAQRRAAEVLARAGLAQSAWPKLPHQLSGGMVRRLLLAMALVGAPSLLIADEPTPGLDEEAVRRALQRLRDLADEGCGILLITHDLPASVEVADRVAVMRAGEVVECAPAAAFEGLGEGLRTPYARALVRALPKNEFIGCGEPRSLAAEGAEPVLEEDCALGA